MSADACTGWIIDVDGCLVRTGRGGGAGGTVLPGAIEFLTDLQRRGEPYVVCTNASERPPEEYSRNLRGLGLPVDDAHFATAGSVAADFVATHHRGQPVLGIGSEGFRKTLADRGVMLADREAWSNAHAVVVGAAQQYDISWISAAALAVEAGATLYTCVVDPWFHGGITKSVASSAIIAEGIGWAGGANPIVLGKPSAALGLTLAHRLGVEPSDIIVVGDAPAEVRLAREIGASSYLLLSGATSGEQARALSQDDGLLGVFDGIESLYEHRINRAHQMKGRDNK